MTAPVSVAQALEVKFGTRVDKKMVEAFRRTWLDGVALAYGEGGPVIGNLNVFFTVPGTDLAKSLAPYAVSETGLYVGYQEKSGMFKKTPAVKYFPSASIASVKRGLKHDPDGSVWRSMTLLGARGEALCEMTSFSSAGSATDFAHAAMRDLAMGLGLPIDEEFDF